MNIAILQARVTSSRLPNKVLLPILGQPILARQIERQRRAEAEAGTALGRFGDPREYGALVAFLASDRSSYMNGTSIAIDGGALKTIS